MMRPTMSSKPMHYIIYTSFYCAYLIASAAEGTTNRVAAAYVAIHHQHAALALVRASRPRRHRPSTPPPLLLTAFNADDRRPKSYNTTVVADHVFRAPTVEHLQTIQERQIFHSLQSSQVFCMSSNLCRHGHPQAFGFHPTAGPKLVSGLFRLSCPLLCEAIDSYEGEGGVRQMSDWVMSKDIGEDRKDDDDEVGWKRRGYEEANAVQRRIRRELTSEDDRGRLVARLGEHNSEAFMGSGVAGIPPGQTFDVKCVHAHVADHLCRRGPSFFTSHNETDGDHNLNISEEEKGGNVIGRHALRILEGRGVPIDGNEMCWKQCDVRHRRAPGDWGYLARKNRSGLRRRGSNSRTRKF
mmetsp:Transcript_17549/g.37954  ORF Transcript_17549/g.37954 Transcript_17549/m.37954 type:complete len:354 (+) Transcript_17549:86-1147(+)